MNKSSLVLSFKKEHSYFITNRNASNAAPDSARHNVPPGTGPIAVPSTNLTSYRTSSGRAAASSAPITSPSKGTFSPRVPRYSPTPAISD